MPDTDLRRLLKRVRRALRDGELDGELCLYCRDGEGSACAWQPSFGFVIDVCPYDEGEDVVIHVAPDLEF